MERAVPSWFEMLDDGAALRRVPGAEGVEVEFVAPRARLSLRAAWIGVAKVSAYSVS